MRRPQYRALLLGLLLVVAGCSAPVSTGDTETGTATDADTPVGTTAPAETTAPASPAEAPTTEPTTRTTAEPATTERTDAPDVTVEGGDLPVDVGRIYARVQALTDVEAEPPTVVVDDPRERESDADRDGMLGTLGLSGGSVDDLDCGTVASASASSDRVRIVPDGLTPAEIELVLAHEFAHVLQANNDLEAEYDRGGRDGSYLRWALSEGGAVYVANEYAERYDLSWDSGDRPLELRRCFYETAPDGFRTVTAVYYFGGEYFDRALDDPANFASAYESLPNTTEGLLHAEPAGADPPVDLDVEVDSERWFDTELGSFGELSTRLVLADQLSESRATAGADGWGNDVAYEFDRADESGYVWVHRWDDAGEADEFLAAAGAYADARTGGATVRVVRVDETTTALVVGTGAFHEATTVDETNGTVTVTVAE